MTTPDPHVPNMNTFPGGQSQGGQPASQPYVPARPVQPVAPAQSVQQTPQGYSAVPQEGAPGQPAYRGVPQPVALYSLAPQRQVPEKISRLSFICAIIGLVVLVPSLLYCAYIVDSAVHSDHPEGGGFVWIIPFAVYMGVLLPINLIGLISGSQKVGPSVSGRQRMWSLLGIGLNVLPWVIAAALLVWIRTSSFPGVAGAVLVLG